MLRYEHLERRFLLAATRIFEAHEIDFTSRGSFGQARSAYAADVDGDGDLDVFSVSRAEGIIAWHENIGDGIWVQARVVKNEAEPATVGDEELVHCEEVVGLADPAA